MKSISARLALWYAIAATCTLAALFVAGYQMLSSRLVHGLDLLNEAEFKQIQARLGNDYDKLDLQLINDRVRETAEYASVLFYINIHNPHANLLYYSPNLNGVAIPDIPGEHEYNTVIPGIGGVRAGEYLMNGVEVTVATPSGQINTVLEGYTEVCAVLLAAMLLTSVGIGYGLSRIALRPVRLLSETARRVSSDNLSERMPVANVQDEISDLARLLNETFARLESSFNQIRRFSADASHELKTPLSLVRLHAEKMLVDGGLLTAQEEAVQIILEEVSGLDNIIDQLLFLSRAEANAIKLDLAPRDPEAFLRSFSADARELIEYRGHRFAFEHQGTGNVRFDGKWIRQVLLNLISNAIKVSPPGGLITLKSVVEEDRWTVRLEDEGPGLPEDKLEYIFERFVRLPTAGTTDVGNGLGLSICRSILNLHGGRIYSQNRDGNAGIVVTFEV